MAYISSEKRKYYESMQLKQFCCDCFFLSDLHTEILLKKQFLRIGIVDLKY